MSEDTFQNESPKKDTFFKIILGILFIFTLMSIGVDTDQYQQRQDLKIPGWYFGIIFSVDVIMLISIVLIYFYKKMAVIAFPVFMALHFYFHVYYLDTFLYNDIMALFIYTLILLAVIPKWQFYK